MASKKKLKKLFPHLMGEIEAKKSAVRIRSVRTSVKGGEKAISGHKLQGYVPDVIDFIRRCDTDEQALEIISYLESRKEITPAYAEKLREQLKKKGLRSFGTKKEHGYYFRVTE